jgi:uncharacterized membrane protein
MSVTTQHEREVDVGTEFDPFIAGFSFGTLIGTGPLLTPKLSGSVLVLVLLWMAYLCLSGGLSGLEAAALALLHQVAEHARMAFGLGVGAVISFTVLRELLKKDPGE